jgi:Fic family protein
MEQRCDKEPLSEHVIRNYHALVFSDHRSAGSYRKHDIFMDGSAIRRRPAFKVPTAMSALNSNLERIQQNLDTSGAREVEALIRYSAEIHYEIGLIHPFEDANGRVARLAMNHFLRRYGAGYVIYPPMHKSNALWEALQEAHQGRKDRLYLLAAESYIPL